MSDHTSRLRIRIVFDDGGVLGPGKADLLALIQETGSISAAGRAMEMSYKRAWSLVGELNALFYAPLVESARGGAKGGGAMLTLLGAEVLALYRQVEAASAEAGHAELARLNGLRVDMSGGK